MSIEPHDWDKRSVCSLLPMDRMAEGYALVEGVKVGGMTMHCVYCSHDIVWVIVCGNGEVYHTQDLSWWKFVDPQKEDG